MRMHRCFSNPQLFFEPKGRGNALTHSKHPIATPSALRSIQAAPNHSQTASLDLNYRSAKLDFLPQILESRSFSEQISIFRQHRKLFKFSAEIQSAEKPQETRRWIRHKNKREIIKNLEVHNRSRRRTSCRNTLCETPVYTLTHVALLTEPEDRKCAYGAKKNLRNFKIYDVF